MIYRLDDRTPKLPGEGRYWIAPTAVVIGDVQLGEDASIWFGAVVRGDNDPIIIGPRTNVQDGSVLHSDVGAPLIIGAGVTIGHMAMVHSCTIGDNSLIGIGAVILAGAKIGRDCLIGAGALVTGSAVIPDGSMVLGRPGKVTRSLDGADMAGIARSAKSYVANARRFAWDLAPV